MKYCKGCNTNKALDNFRIMKERRKSKGNFTYPCSVCKECERKRALINYHNKREKYIEQNRIYKIENRDKINETRRKYIKEKVKDDLFRLKRNMKCLISTKIKKTKHTNDYLGSDILLIKKWIEFNFDDIMSWDNHGSYWEIDHTIAVANFNLYSVNEQLLCFNWKNLMPLKREINQKKSNKISPCRYFYQEYQLNKFYETNPEIKDELKNFIPKYANKVSELLKKFFFECNTLKLRETP